MSVPISLPFPNLQNGQTADATQVKQNFDALAAAFGSAAAAGVNSDITQLNGIIVPLLPAFGGSTVYTSQTASTGTNTIAVPTVIPSNFVLSAGNVVVFKAGGSNTGAATLNVNSTGPIPLQRRTPGGLAALVGGEIVNGAVITAVYDGSVYQITSNVPAASAFFVGAAPSTGTNTIVLAGTYPTDYSLTAAPLPVLAFRAGGTNTGPATLQVGATTATAVLKRTSQGLLALTGGEIVAGTVVAVAHDGTQYQLLSTSAPTYPTRTILTSGSGTYNTPGGCKQLFGRMIAGGGGGGCLNGPNSGAGGPSSFAGVTANGGAQGGLASGSSNSAAAPGLGGSGGVDGPNATSVLRIAGNSGVIGMSANAAAGTTVNLLGGPGAGSPFGPGGRGGGNSSGLTAGASAIAPGAGGGGSQQSASGNAASGGGGGGEGEYVEFYINNPAATYAFAVGAAGAAGGGGGGGAGGPGIIIVEERY